MRNPTFATIAAVIAAVFTTACGSAEPEHDPQPEPQLGAGGTGASEHGGGRTAPAAAPGQAAHADWQHEPLGEVIAKGLAFLVAAQGADGGYGQDGRDPRADVGLESQGTDVANTAMVALALLRSGTTPKDGRYTDQLLAAIDFVTRHVEKSPADGLAITDRTGTQIQRKLGPHVDTFLASMLLAEVKGRMPDAAGEQRVSAALEKCVDKIEKNQQGDGSWNAGGGWAPIISTSLASRGLDAARAKGVEVDGKVLSRVDEYTRGQFDDRERKFEVGSGDAGVALYKVAQMYEQASRVPASGAAPTAVAANRAMLGAADELLESESFQAGFGSMGGEEFISYMNLSDSLLRQGGEKWQSWNDDIKQRLAKLQNQDGSWAGHHCITGRIACTSAALLTLLAERTAAKPGA